MAKAFLLSTTLLQLQCQHPSPVVAPDAVPLDAEPGRETRSPRAGHLRRQRRGTDPAPVVDLLRIDLHAPGAAADEDRAQLPFGPGCIKLRLVLELEQKL